MAAGQEIIEGSAAEIDEVATAASDITDMLTIDLGELEIPEAVNPFTLADQLADILGIEIAPTLEFATKTLTDTYNILGLIMGNWTLLAVTLPVTLLLFALLRLAGTHFVNRSLTLRFLLVPAAGLVLGILVALAAPEVGFTDAFLLIFGLLSIGMGVWLALRPNSG